MKIAYIGNFNKLWDEEYIAQAFEKLDHEVLRLPERLAHSQMIQHIEVFKPDFVLWAKLGVARPDVLIQWLKQKKIKTVCWVWDLYWGYPREPKITTDAMFKADKVFTSDGGHDERWKEVGIDHQCIRQGIREEDCYREFGDKLYDVVFVGSDNKYNTERNAILEKVQKDFNLTWFGKENSDEVRGPKLNRLFGQSKVIIGDSVYTPNYWSNRVVETLGRGGFLIHAYVEGIDKEYPYLVTYERGNYQDLKDKINHYIQNPEQREEIINKNIEWVKKHHLIQHECEKLCQSL